jgi:beta-ribofuranosylaminobenzene 5'-phosphate synthase
MIRVRTASRLHFGLLSLGFAGPGRAGRWPDRRGEPVLPARGFGSAGLMVQAPGVCVTASPAPDWSAHGPLAERALAFARRFVQGILPHPIPPQRLAIDHAAPEHLGLGTGTQLALAVARALALAGGVPHFDAPDLARLMGRGLRSALGVHGFIHGGFLVDGGKGEADALAPLVARLAFPADWRVVLALPTWGPGLHGLPEREAFQQLAARQPALADTDALCRLVLLGMLPALQEQDLAAFGEALFDFNARVGAAFARVQGGPYAGPRVAELVAWLRESCPGVGQSSWGPGVFAVVGDGDRASHLAERLRLRFGLGPEQVLVTAACNHGATIERDERPAPG